ncbi:hypothetical protein PYW08_009498 [Mythimna loreyi]|uniref:Uncharacterized protein n=1 Tax=Mythimna loreyi TaxID=667449 RepID=A0ACC2Q675_9NEOP|nr:hypothetical protein PYW08_009498 [Mythimna loreyi]
MLCLAFGVCVLCLILVRIKYGRDKSSILLPPALPGKLPFFGHTHKVIRNFTNMQELVKHAANDCAKQGGVTHLVFGRDLYYLIVDPQDAFTASNACLRRHYGQNFAENWMGKGIALSTGDVWKYHRKLLNPAFTLPVIHGFLDVFNSQSKKLADSLEPHVGKGSFDHCPYLLNNSLETFCVGTFGIDAFNDRESLQEYMDAVHKMVIIIMDRVLKFWTHNDFIYWLTGLKKKEDDVLKIIYSLADAVLQKKKATMANEGSNINTEFDITGTKYKPFLDLLLELSKNGALTDKQIKEELNTIVATGFETVSNQLTYTLLQLGAYPEVQEKLYKELLQVLGPDRDVGKNDVNKLVYTNAVIMESLRTLPSIPIMLRCVDNDVRLKNYTMRAGSCCLIFPLACDYDQSWGARTDQFHPERWLEGDFKDDKEFAAFGLGKRSCIGKTYAIVSMKVALAHLLRRYRVKADISKLKMKYEFVMRPLSGHEISIEKRT